MCTQLVVTDLTDRTTADETMHNIINVQRYSNLHRLLRVTAYVCRFIKNCRSGQFKGQLHSLTATELEQAELLWICSCQATHYREEMQQLKTNKPKASSIKQLQVFLGDTQAIRCTTGFTMQTLMKSRNFHICCQRNTYLQHWWFKQLTNHLGILA